MFYVSLQGQWGPQIIFCRLPSGGTTLPAVSSNGPLQMMFFIGDTLPWPGGAGTRGLGLPPLWVPWVIFPVGVLVCLWLHPCDFLGGWSWLEEHQQLPGFVLVADWLSLLILSSSRWAATNACRWASVASESLWLYESSPCSLSWGISSHDRAEGCLWVPVLDLPLVYHHPSFARGNLPQRTKCPGLAPAPILVCAVKGLAASSTDRLWYIALRSPPGRSCIPQAGWQVHPS